MTLRPNLDYKKVAPGFKWADVHDELDWLPGGRLNMAHEAIDRHANGPNRDKTALIWRGRNGERETYTFGRLKAKTDRFANVLKSLGIERGDRVFIYLDRIPELYVSFFGILKTGAVACPIFSGLGLEVAKERLKECATKVLVTHPGLRQRISALIPELFDLQHIVVVNRDDRYPEPTDMADLGYEAEMGKASRDYEMVATGQYDSSVISYTSGTTGRPRGVVHRHEAVVQQHATGKWVLDLHEDDIFWCTADPGWITGTAYGMVAPWTNGVTQVVSEGGLSADSCAELIQKHRVTVWYTAPPVINLLMRAGADLLERYDLSSLRHIVSVGEGLGPEAVAWSADALAKPIHDTWWQTETGAILVANYPGVEVRPGSMGLPVPGVEVAILGEDYKQLPAGIDGHLAVRPAWPSMFETYWDDTETYRSRFRRGWYVSGDRARADQDGYLWSASRAAES